MNAIYRPAALDDIDRIIDYFNRHARPNTASRFENRLFESVDRIQVMPGIGSRWRAVRGIVGPVRFVPIRSYSKWLIFFTITGPNELTILRVLHSAMNLRKLLRQA